MQTFTTDKKYMIAGERITPKGSHILTCCHELLEWLLAALIYPILYRFFSYMTCFESLNITLCKLLKHPDT